MQALLDDPVCLKVMAAELMVGVCDGGSGDVLASVSCKWCLWLW